MGAVRMCAAASLRRRWGSVIALTVLVGLVGAFVLATLAGAARTESAFTRFRDETREADLTIFAPAADLKSLARLRAVPGVESVFAGRALAGTVDGQQAAIGGLLDPTLVERPRIIGGRRPRQDRVHEVALPEPLAANLRAHVGDTVTIRGFTQKQIKQILTGELITEPAGPKVPVRVVGITRAPSDLSILGTQGGVLFTTYEFTRRFGDQFGSFAPYVLRVRLSDPGAATPFVQEARRLLASKGDRGEFQVEPTSETEGGVQQSIDVLATGLRIAALVAALVGLVVIAIALRRFGERDSPDLPTLRGLGISRLGRTLVVGLPTAPIALGGGALAFVIALAASPVMPLGLARQAEPDPGLDFDPLILGVGAVAVACVVIALGLLAARRVVAASARTETPKSSSVSRALAGAPLAPPIAVGASMALESGRGASAVPVRSAIAGAVVAITGVVAVVVFAASLGTLATTPAAYGYNWDAHVYSGALARTDAAPSCNSLRTAVADDPAVAALAMTCSDSLEVDGHSVTGIAFRSLKGAVTPTVIDGRAPRAADEVALGREALDRIDAGLGDRVRIVGPDGRRTYRVVGAVVLPSFSAPSGALGNAQAVAAGAVLTSAGLRSLSATEEGTDTPIVVRWKPGADLAAAQRRLAALPEGVTRPLSAIVPLEVDRLEQIDALPWVLGAFLALIGIFGVGYVLVSSVRRRGRELAVLKTLGFRRRQIGATVATQATVLGAIGLLLGMPLGVIVGRAVWKAVATGAGFASIATVPVAGLVGLVLATLVIVNLIAVVPARRAARLRPAVVLRSE
ncbi:MAG: FtsX-like permease family protein [Acidimicrobiia bacterium]|nr:FtsX-like permease family protein [Acidimicrobiia bacterium]